VARPLVLAHRGARAVAPENTTEAFDRALAMGADGVELDVHRTADAELVVHHDAEASGVGILSEHRLGDIRRARPEIPTLAEALDACHGALVNIEIKNLPTDADFDPDETTAELVVGLLGDREGGDEVVVSSFNLSSVDRVRVLEPRIATGLLVMIGFDPLEALAVCADHGHEALHPFVGMLEGPMAASVVERARELDLGVRTWTVNDGAEIRRLAGAGVDAVITDVPDLALAALERVRE
jgi:glycerophosphoryl diester phosphodiesterase